MIRFIDLRGMETGRNFAFWDTFVDEFVKFNNVRAWSNIIEFIDDVQNHFLALPDTPSCRTLPGVLYRFRKLIPKDIPLTFEDTHAEKPEPELCVDCVLHSTSYSNHYCKTGSIRNPVTGMLVHQWVDCDKERTAEGSCGPEADNFEPK